MSERDAKITTDKDGNRVRRGLTFEETTWYENYQRNRILPEADRKAPGHKEDEKFLQLDLKHHYACMLALEHELRGKPPVH